MNIQLIEKDGIIKDYTFIGVFMEHSEGVSYYFPDEDTKASWHKYLKNEPLSLTVQSIGVLLYQLDDPLMQSIYGMQFDVIRNNQKFFKEFGEKYFGEDGLFLSEPLFIDFVAGWLSSHANNSAVNDAFEDNEDTVVFEDGTKIKLLDMNQSSDDLYGKIFVQSSKIEKLTLDMETVISFFK